VTEGIFPLAPLGTCEGTHIALPAALAAKKGTYAVSVHETDGLGHWRQRPFRHRRSGMKGEVV